MKKWKILLVLLVSFFGPLSVFASPVTSNRSKEKPLVPDDVVVNDQNIYEILSTPAVSELDKIYDFANLYSDRQYAKLYELVRSYIEHTNLDLVIVTQAAIDGLNSVEYARRFYEYNHFSDDGIIFVIYVRSDGSEIYMSNEGEENGRAFQMYSNTRISNLINKVSTDIQRKGYYEATVNYIQALRDSYDRNNGYEDKQVSKDSLRWIVVVASFVAMFTSLTISLVFHSRNNRLKNDSSFIGKIDSSTLVLKTEIDDLIETSKARRKD